MDLWRTTTMAHRHISQRTFQVREWHVKHMEQTLVKFITGLSEDALTVANETEQEIWYILVAYQKE